VLAVGAIGQAGTFPVDSPHAACAIAASEAGGGLFVPAFSCWGPELDLCAPGVAVISCQSPEGHAATDGTSLAAAHVAAVAALVFAHHADFQRDFVNRDARKVGRLFQILKATAQPLGDPPRTGAGLLDAARALGLPARQRFHVPLQAGLENMRHAIRLSGVGGLARDQAPEPIRGPAFVTQLPLSAGPAAAFAGIGLECGMRDLKLAMLSAGLSTGQ
jgi:subtilisin family serine protease